MNPNETDPTETSPDQARREPTVRRRDLVLAGACGAFVAVMVGMSYAAVPFYNWFCRTTGYAGTTQVATSGPSGTVDRTITVRFDANVGPGLPWRFTPEFPSMQVKLGEVVTVNYHVINEAARETYGQAAYNVAPLTTGIYFQKINCFCFTEQTMKPGEKRDMTVVFYVDPKLLQDADNADLNTITLSYTFYPERAPERPVADNTPANKPGRI